MSITYRQVKLTLFAGDSTHSYSYLGSGMIMDVFASWQKI